MRGGWLTCKRPAQDLSRAAARAQHHTSISLNAIPPRSSPRRVSCGRAGRGAPVVLKAAVRGAGRHAAQQARALDRAAAGAGAPRGGRRLALAVQRLRRRRVRREGHARRRRAAARTSAFTNVGFLGFLQGFSTRSSVLRRIRPAAQQQRGTQAGPPRAPRRHGGPRRGEAHGGAGGLPPPAPPGAPPCAEASGVDASSMPASSSAAISSNSVRFSTLLCA